MSRFAERSSSTELIDEAGIPFSDWEVCLNELNAVNTWLGGHAITISGVKKLLPYCKEEPVIIAEIGCGGGDNLKAIHRHFHKKDISFRFVGIDINKACTDFAEKNCREIKDIRFICSDYRLATFESRPHIIFNSLFCHHFSNDQLIEMLRWMSDNSSAGFFINDLQRHPVAFHSISMLTKLFSRSYLVRNDAPISVMRGFLEDEWKKMLHRAEIKNYAIQWRWAFRYLITIVNEQRGKI